MPSQKAHWFLLFILALPLGIAGAAPSLYRCDPCHLGEVGAEHALSPTPTVRWRYSPVNVGIHTASKGSPTIDGGTLYVGSDSGRLYALEAANGRKLWEWRTHPCRAGIHGTPAVDEKKVYIGDYAGWLTALDKHTGALLWETKLGGSIGSSPVIDGERVYIGVETPAPDGYVSAVDRKDGRESLQSVHLGHHTHATPTVDGAAGRIYIGSNRGYFHALKVRDGKFLWTFRSPDARKPSPARDETQDEPAATDDDPPASTGTTSGEIKGTAALVGPKVLFTSWDGFLHCLEAATGREIWRFAAEARSMSSPAVDRAAGRVYFGAHDGWVYAVDLESGREIWRFATGGKIMSSPVIAPLRGSSRKVVLIGSSDKYLYMLDAANGAPYWHHKTKGAITSVPLVFEHRIYVSTDASELLCFE